MRSLIDFLLLILNPIIKCKFIGRIKESDNAKSLLQILLYLLIATIFLISTSCKSVQVNYLNRDELKKSNFNQTPPSAAKKRNYGALRITLKDEEKENFHILYLQKEKSLYSATKIIHKSNNQTLYLSVGYDTKMRSPSFVFKLEF